MHTCATFSVLLKRQRNDETRSFRGAHSPQVRIITELTRIASHNLSCVAKSQRITKTRINTSDFAISRPPRSRRVASQNLLKQKPATLADARTRATGGGMRARNQWLYPEVNISHRDKGVICTVLVWVLVLLCVYHAYWYRFYYWLYYWLYQWLYHVYYHAYYYWNTMAIPWLYYGSTNVSAMVLLLEHHLFYYGSTMVKPWFYNGSTMAYVL